MNNVEENGITPEEFAEKYSDEFESLMSEKSQQQRAGRILQLSDRMLDKLSCALDEVNLCETKEKKRIKEVEYDEELKKPVCETNTELEISKIKTTLIDAGALKQLVSTLKDIKDIHMSFSSREAVNDAEESGVIVISDIEQKEEGRE